MEIESIVKPKRNVCLAVLGYVALLGATACPIILARGTGDMTVAQARELLANPGADANQRHLAAAALGRNALDATRALCALSEEFGLAGIEARASLERLRREVYR